MGESRAVFVLLPGRKEENDHYQLLQEETALAAGRRHGLRTEVAWAPAFDQLRTLKKRLLEPAPERLPLAWLRLGLAATSLTGLLYFVT